MLRDCEDRRNVVAGMRVVGGQERVVEIQFAHCNAVGPGGPFRRDALVLVQPEHCRAGLEWMRLGLRPCAGDRAARDGSSRHRGIVDDAVADHFDDIGFNRHRIGCNFSDLAGKLVGAGERFGGLVGANGMLLHGRAYPVRSVDGVSDLDCDVHSERSRPGGRDR